MPAEILIPNGSGGWQTYVTGGGPIAPPPRSDLVAGQFFPTSDGTTVGIYKPLNELTLATGDVTFTSADNADTIEDTIFDGKVSVTCAELLLKNCLVYGNMAGGNAMFQCSNAAVQNVILEDCTIIPKRLVTDPESYTGFNALGNGVYGHHVTLRRCDIMGSTDCVAIVPSGTNRVDSLLEGNWLHEPTFCSPDPNQTSNATHNDLIQWHGGKGLTLRGNRLDGFYNPNAGASFDPEVLNGDGSHASGNQYFPSQHVTSVLMTNPTINGNVQGDLLVELNWINGGGAGLVLSANDAGAWSVDDGSKIINNWFGWDFRNGVDYGVMAKSTQVFTLSGNHRWDSTSWLHGAEDDFETGVRNPFNTSVSFNVRKNG